MKRYLLTMLLGLLFFTPFSIHAGDDHFVRVSSKNSHYFEFDDGSPYIPIGLNLCSIGISPSPVAGMEKMEFSYLFSVLSRISER